MGRRTGRNFFLSVVMGLVCSAGLVLAGATVQPSSTNALVAGGEVLRINVAEAIGGQTVFGQLAVARVTTAGFVTAYSCDDGIPRGIDGNINKADLNYNGAVNPITSNRLIVKADINGDICFYTSAPADMIIDINGVTDTGITAIANQRTDTRTTTTTPTTTTTTTPTPPTLRGSVAQLNVDLSQWSGSLYGQESDNWSQAEDALIYRTASGGLAVADVDLLAATVTVSNYNASTFVPVGTPVTLSYTGWDRFGGLYAAPNGDLYLVVGRDNMQEDDDRDVVEVRRYSPALKLMGTAHVKGGASQGIKGITVPFSASALDMLLIDDRLVVHMGRKMYQALDGLHHQANFTFEVDTATMTATPFEELGGHAYSSHSFRQQVAFDGSNLFLADHGDAYPRSIQIGVIANYSEQRNADVYDVFKFDGAVGDNHTGATLTGIAAGSNGVVVVGSSIQHLKADGASGNAGDTRNVYVATLDPDSGANTLKWLTAFSATGGPTVSTPRIVKVHDNQFAVLFTVVEGDMARTEYRLIDAQGSVLVSSTFPGFEFSSVDVPLLVDDTILWLGKNPAANAEGASLFALSM